MKKISQQVLRDMYGEVPMRVEQAVRTRIRSLPEQTGTAPRRGVRMGMALAFALVLLGSVAVAAGTLPGLRAWLAPQVDMQITEPGILLGELEGVTFTLTEAARYGTTVMLSVHEKPTQEGVAVLPWINGIAALSRKGYHALPEDTTLLDLPMSVLCSTKQDESISRMTAAEYLAQTGRTAVWTDLTLFPSTESGAWPEGGMTEIFVTPLEDGSAMVFVVQENCERAEDTLLLDVRYGAITEVEMTEKFASRPRMQELFPYRRAGVVEALLPEKTLSGCLRAETTQARISKGGCVTVSNLVVTPMPYGWIVSCDAEAEGLDEIRLLTIAYDGGVMNFAEDWPVWYEIGEGRQHAVITSSVYAGSLPEQLVLTFQGGGFHYRVELPLMEAD